MSAALHDHQSPVMAFAVWARVLPQFDTRQHTANIQDDYDILSDNDCLSDFGVQSIADTDSDSFSISTNFYATSDEQSSGYASWLAMFVTPWDEPRGKTVDELNEFEREFPYCSINRAEANTMAFAGRGDAGHSFKDMRSAAKSRRRARVENEKYWGYRAVKRGDLNDSTFYDTFLKEAAPRIPVMSMSKKILFQEAQRYPRPPKHSHRCYSKDRSPFQLSYIERMKARKHKAQSLEDDSHLEYLDWWEEMQMEILLDEEYSQWEYACSECWTPVDESDELSRLRVVREQACTHAARDCPG